MEYHVLSNIDIVKIIAFGLMAGLFLAICVFVNLAKRDASKQEIGKGLLRKVMPWIVLLLFLSELSLFIYRAIDYPWNFVPEPSQASMIREVNEVRVTRYGEPAIYPVWGWANDYQYDLLSAFSASILWFCWCIYAFNFKPSDVSWWKKICKVIAYLILSAFIYAFRFHYFDDLLVYALFPLVVFILLWLAKDRTPKQIVIPVVAEEITSKLISHEETTKPIENEVPSRFMSHQEKIKFEGEMGDVDLEPINEELSAIEDVLESKAPVQEIKPKVEIVTEEEPARQMDKQIKKELAIPDMIYCKHCGKRIEADSKFCKYCGGRL